MNNKIIKFLSIIKNASLAKKDSLIIDYSLILLKCTEALYREGIILSYYTVKNNSEVKIFIKLRSFDNMLLTCKLKSVSKPSNIRYFPYHQICRISVKEKTCFFFTNLGVLTLEECKKKRVGGAFSFFV